MLLIRVLMSIFNIQQMYAQQPQQSAQYRQQGEEGAEEGGQGYGAG